MSLTFTGRNMDFPNSLKEYAEKKMRRLQRHVKEIDEMNFTLSKNKHDYCLDINFRAGHIHLLTKSSDATSRAAIDKAIDTLESQITKAKEKRFRTNESVSRLSIDEFEETGEENEADTA